MSDVRSDLPQGWTWAKLGDVVRIVSTQVLPKRDPDQRFNYLALEHIEAGTGRIINFGPTLGRYIRSNKFTFRAGDVLYGRLRPYLRKTIVAEFDGVSATDLIPLRPLDAIDPAYLQRYLLSPQALEYVYPLMAGIKMPRLRTGDLHAMPVPVPPTPEQRRIVAKIEALFEQIRTAREALDRIPPLLKKFRQSVLAAAFRGDLTRDWREQHPDIERASALLDRIRAERRRKWEQDLRAMGKDPRKVRYKEVAPPDGGRLDSLPDGWEYTTVLELGCLDEDPVLTGPFGAQLPSKEFVPEGVPVIAIGNVGWGRLQLDKLDHVKSEKALKLRRYTLRPGDVLFTRSGTVGRSAVVPDEANGWLMSYHLLRVRVDRNVCDPMYLYFVFRGNPEIQEQITEQARGATRPGFNTILLKRLRVPLAPMAEQREILCRMKDMFAWIDVIEAAVEATRRRADKLEQSILARAFRGDLLPQDPNDEPASALLDRIRTERIRSGARRRPTVSHRNGKKLQNRSTMADV